LADPGGRVTLPRPFIPLKVQRDAALIQLGLDPKTAELDHDPALGLRERTDTGGYIPDANNPHYLKWRDPVGHAKKTRGSKQTTAGSDVHLIAKGKRLRRAQAIVNAWLSAAPAGTAEAALAMLPKPRHKAKIASRPFSKQHRPLRSGEQAERATMRAVNECFALLNLVTKTIWAPSIRRSRGACIATLTGNRPKTRWEVYKADGWRVIRVRVVPIGRPR
jgi:hypothetical protein